MFRFCHIKPCPAIWPFFRDRLAATLVISVGLFLTPLTCTATDTPTGNKLCENGVFTSDGCVLTTILPPIIPGISPTYSSVATRPVVTKPVKKTLTAKVKVRSAVSKASEPRARAKTKGYAKVYRSTFDRMRDGRGIWRGLVRGHGRVQLILQFLQNKRVVIARTVGRVNLANGESTPFCLLYTSDAADDP